MHAGFCYCYSMETISLALEAFNKIWIPFGEEDDKRNKDRAKAMFTDLARTMGTGRALYKILPPIGVEIEDKVSKDEVAFAIDVDMDVPFVGKIDALGEHRSTKDLWGIEYKTASELSDRLLSGFMLNPQILCYTLALSTYTDRNVRGVIIVGLFVGKRQVKTVVYPVYVDAHVLKRVPLWIRHQHEKIRACEATGEWPQEFSLCNPYSCFGMPGYTCEYQALCLQEDWTDLISMFQIAEERPFVIKKKESEE